MTADNLGRFLGLSYKTREELLLGRMETTVFQPPTCERIKFATARNGARGSSHAQRSIPHSSPEGCQTHAGSAHFAQPPEFQAA